MEGLLLFPLSLELLDFDIFSPELPELEPPELPELEPPELPELEPPELLELELLEPPLRTFGVGGVARAIAL
jgi:hypothetical protein